MPYCHTCEKHFQSLGIARHRAMHRDKKQNCTITMGGYKYFHNYKDGRGLIITPGNEKAQTPEGFLNGFIQK